MPPPEVQCDVVTWSLFGLSLAAYNAHLLVPDRGAGRIRLVKARLRANGKTMPRKAKTQSARRRHRTPKP